MFSRNIYDTSVKKKERRMAMYLVSILALSLYVVLTLEVSYKGAALC